MQPPDVPAALAKRQSEGELLRILHRKQPECRLYVRAVCKLERCAISNGLFVIVSPSQT